MSRAFVKETDADAALDLPDRPVSEHPNDVTAEGLAQIEAAVAASQAAHGHRAGGGGSRRDGAGVPRPALLERAARHPQRVGRMRMTPHRSGLAAR